MLPPSNPPAAGCAPSCTRSLWLAATLLIVSSGCAQDRAPTDAGGAGELGKGDFLLVCTEDDATCSPAQQTGPRPERIALGSSFTLSYAGRVPANPRGEPTRIDILAASDWHLSSAPERMTAIDTGFTAVLARTAEGTITDFAHLQIVQVASLALQGEPALHPGGAATWQAAALDAGGNPLAGTLDYAWSLSDPQIAVLDEGQGRVVRVRGLAPGTVTLTVRAAGLQASATLPVSAS